jgi:hypothetical protein
MGFEVIFLTPKNTSSYLDINHIRDLNNKIESSNKKAKKDLVKLSLLAMHGGVYIDLSLIIVNDLTWLKNLATDPRIVNRNATNNR